MKTKTYSAIVIIVIMLFSCTSCNLAPGSYPYAEEYRFSVNESELIHAIEKFKEVNPDYCIPPQIKLKDGRKDTPDDHWYHVYFYYKNENRIINTWVRQFDKGNTSFAFVAINDGLKLGNWKRINKDFSHKDNKLQKKKFEQEILNKIRKSIE